MATPFTDAENQIVADALSSGDPDEPARALVRIMNQRELSMRATIDEQAKMIGNISVERDHWRKAALSLGQGFDRMATFEVRTIIEDVRSYLQSEDLKKYEDARGRRGVV